MFGGNWEPVGRWRAERASLVHSPPSSVAVVVYDNEIDYQGYDDSYEFKYSVHIILSHIFSRRAGIGSDCA